jgi:hypothetical protein
VCDKLGLPFHEPPETYSTSPHLFEELDIPEEATGVLPRGERTRAGLDAEQIEDLGGRAPRGNPRRGGRPAGSETRAVGAEPRAAASTRSRRRTRGALRSGEVGTPEPEAKAAEAARPRRRRRRPAGAATPAD